MNHVFAQTEWEKYPNNPVLNLGPGSAWDHDMVSASAVIFDGKIYKMWYTGGDTLKCRIGYATSTDGITWSRYSGNPVLTETESSEWEYWHVATPSVIFHGNEYKMWYHACSDEAEHSIGYATSPDGIAWSKHPANPVLVSGAAGKWDEKFVNSPTVLFDGTKYRMWYTACNNSIHFKIGYATSSDGITWIKHPSPVLDVGSTGAWDSVGTRTAVVIFARSEYKMWYGGYDGSNYRIGYATSPDGINWTKYDDPNTTLPPFAESDPVLDIGPDRSWEGVEVYYPSVLFDGSEYKMWYTGADGSQSWIGYAVSSPQEGTSTAISVETVHKVSKDDSFPAAINVGDISNLAGFQFGIAFAPSVLRAVTVEEGTFLSDNGGTYWLKPDIDNKAGIITGTACAMTSKGGADGSGTLATITFKAVSIGESDIKLQNIVLSDSTGGVIPAATADASVIVVDYPSWDVNKDGAVNVIDMVLVGQYLGESIIAPQYPNPDVNGDSIVDTRDIVLVGKHFGEVYSSSAPSRDIWSIDPQYLPILAKIYAIMEAEPFTGPDLITTKSLIFRLMANAGIIRTEVFQNYPNPFNPETWIPYQLAEDVKVTITIYDASGKFVRTLDLEHKTPGFYMTKDKAAYWDGKNETGEQAASGVYFYTIQAGEFTATKKMVIAE